MTTMHHQSVLTAITILFVYYLETYDTLALTVPDSPTSPSNTYIIQVCENKDCLKQFPSTGGVDGLFQVLSDLIHPMTTNVVLQRSGCLSHCGKGPNICISSTFMKTKTNTFSGVKDVYIASGILKDECNVEVSPLLLAAVDMMSQANRGNNVTFVFLFIRNLPFFKNWCYPWLMYHKVSSPEKKIQLLSSVIDQLSSDVTNDDLKGSMALLHATLMRSNVYLEMIPPNIPFALKDVHYCVKLIGFMEGIINKDHQQLFESSSVLFGKVYRVLADAEEASGNYNGAKNAILEWIRLNPSFKAKAEKDLLRLNRMLNPK